MSEKGSNPSGSPTSPMPTTSPNQTAEPSATEEANASSLKFAAPPPRSESGDSSFDMITADDATPADPKAAIEARNQQVFARKLHRVFAVTAIPFAIIIGIFFLLLLFKARIEAHTVGRVIAAFCVAMAFIMTAILAYLHLCAWTDPPQQKRIIRILAMVPIYALSSLLALWRHDIAPIVGLLRDGYESVVIFSFYNLLMGYLDGEEAAFQKRQRQSIKCFAPLCCFSFNLTRSTFRTWKVLLAQYVILKPIMSFVAVLLLVNGMYDESSWSPRNAHVWFVLILNVSVTLAFTSLVYFFMEYKEQLQAHKPFGKFAAVKTVVFLTFWQSVFLGICVSLGWIKPSKEGLWTPEEVSTGIQDFLICLEMLLMSYLHESVFPETPYIPETGFHRIDWRTLVDVVNLTDLPRDAGIALAQAAPDVLPLKRPREK